MESELGRYEAALGEDASFIPVANVPLNAPWHNSVEDVPNGGYSSVDFPNLLPGRNRPNHQSVVERDRLRRGVAHTREQIVCKRTGRLRRKHRQVAEKKAKLIQCKCASRCYTKLTLLSITEMHKDLHENSEENSKREFVARYVKEKKDTRGKRKRFAYHLPQIDVSMESEQTFNGTIEVCRAFFIGATSFSEKFISHTLKHKVKGAIVERDARGKHRHNNGVTQRQYNEVCRQIAAVPRVPSHYTRKKSRRLYIWRSYSRLSLFKDYKQRKAIEWAEYWRRRDDYDARKLRSSSIGPTSFPIEPAKTVGRTTFFAIMKANFPRLSFFMPKADRCQTCMR